jgi:hypothetical protein
MTPPSNAGGEGREVYDAADFGARVLVAMADRPCREVAPEIGISPSTLNRVTRGKMPDLPTYFAICRWLSMPSELRTLDAPAFGALHRVQHAAPSLVKPKLGGSIVEWASEEIAALRACLAREIADDRAAALVEAAVAEEGA